MPITEDGRAVKRPAELERAHWAHIQSDPNPHPQYALDTDLSDHVAASDPHTGYRLESVPIARADCATGFTLHGRSAPGSSPSSPTRGDTWVDTDLMHLFVYYGSTTGWARPWNVPWGKIASASSGTSDQSGITSIVDITSVTVTFTAVANRSYKATLWLPSIFQATGGAITLSLTDGSNTLLKQSLINPTGVSNVNTAPHVIHEFTASAGSYTVKGRIAANSSATIDHASGQTSYILVEDIGASGSAPVA